MRVGRCRVISTRIHLLCSEKSGFAFCIRDFAIYNGWILCVILFGQQCGHLRSLCFSCVLIVLCAASTPIQSDPLKKRWIYWNRWEHLQWSDQWCLGYVLQLCGFKLFKCHSSVSFSDWIRPMLFFVIQVDPHSGTVGVQNNVNTRRRADTSSTRHHIRPSCPDQECSPSTVSAVVCVWERDKNEGIWDSYHWVVKLILK